MQSLDLVLFKSLLSFLLAFSISLLTLFSFLVCDNLFLSLFSFKSLGRLTIMHFFNYIFIFWMSEYQVINIEWLINWLMNFQYSAQTANFTHLIFWFCYTSDRYHIDNFQIIDINTKVRRIVWSKFVNIFILLKMKYL